MTKLLMKQLIVFVFLTSVSLFAFSQHQSSFSLPAGVGSNDYHHDKIIFKVKSEFAAQCKDHQIEVESLQKALNSIGVSGVYRKFPDIMPPSAAKDENGRLYTDLSVIYAADINPGLNIVKAVNAIIASGAVDYAQPQYIHQPLNYVPSDPLNFNQYHLGIIGLYAAWDQYRGDTNIVVGIVDWGTDIDHPDLVQNVKYNYNDQIDGIDNDNDGYVDNFRGWDLGEDDNNPQGVITHGCFVAGLAGAATDNNVGISGTGFLCKHLPVKVCNDNNIGTMEYEGIVYAAEHGCSIINCSWGAKFYTGPYGQDIINYAAINKGALILSACGNDDNTRRFFPASYDNVLSVAATNSTDIKWSGSSYGYTIDIAAPGENVWSTLDGGTYGSSSGTSFSAPIVAGCAAILKTRFPALSGVQIGEKLKVSADIIDTLPGNIAYVDKLGSGRINIMAAINDTTHPSVEMINRAFSNTQGGEYFNPGDTVLITGNFINYLEPSTAALKVKLSSTSPYITIYDSVFNIGALSTMGSVSNQSAPFRVLLKSNVPVDYELLLKLEFTDTDYRSVQYLFLNVNTGYINIDTNKIGTTFTSNGMIGYNNGSSLQGLGFTYNSGKTLMAVGGFIIGKSATQVSDAIYGTNGTYDMDFYSLIRAHSVDPPLVSNLDLFTLFNDSLAGSSRLNVEIKSRAFAWDTSDKSKFVLLEYTIVNKNLISVNSVYAGVYMDWDIKNYMSNRTGYDPENKLGYCFSTEGGTYTGISLVSNGPAIHYAFDNDGSNGSINVFDGFTSSEKYIALKTFRNEAGISGNGNDVSSLLSSGPYTIPSGDSVKVVFALIAGDHLGDLEGSADAAYQQYNYAGFEDFSAENGNVLYQNQPNPFADESIIEFYLSEKQHIRLSLYSLDGREVLLFDGIKEKGMHQYRFLTVPDPGVYVYTLRGEDFLLKKKCCITK